MNKAKQQNYGRVFEPAREEEAREIARKIIKLIKEEDLTYREAEAVLELCEGYLKDLCKLSDWSYTDR